MPTVLDLLGLKIPDVVQGQSLAPLAKGQPFQRRGPVMTSRFADPEAKKIGFVPENRIDAVAFWTQTGNSSIARRLLKPESTRWSCTTGAPIAMRPKTSPRSTRRRSTGMMTEIAKWMDAQKQIRNSLSRGPKAILDRQTIDRLRSLGYLGGNTN